MIPSLSFSQQASSGATGGKLDTRTNALNEGDWNTSNGASASAGGLGMNSKTMTYVAIGFAALWFMKKRGA